MRAMRKWIMTLCLAVALASAGSAWAAPDTRENRLAAAQRYLETTPIEGMFDKIIDQMAKSGQIPMDQTELMAEFTARLDIAKLKTVTLAAMVKHFTADELNAMADFYGSAAGRSVVRKMGAYMADVLPVIQTETVRVMQEIVQDLKAGKLKQRSKRSY